MKQMLSDIREFYKAVGAESQFTTIPTADIPSHLKDVRQNLIFEEVGELFKAMNNKDLEQIFDAILDIQYVVLGTALTYGLEHRMEAGWKEVQRSNMAKVGPDGKVNMRADGKILKPETWTPPDLHGVLKPLILEELEADERLKRERAGAARHSFDMADRQTHHEQLQVEALEHSARVAMKKLNDFKKGIIK